MIVHGQNYVSNKTCGTQDTSQLQNDALNDAELVRRRYREYADANNESNAIPPPKIWRRTTKKDTSVKNNYPRTSRSPTRTSHAVEPQDEQGCVYETPSATKEWSKIFSLMIATHGLDPSPTSQTLIQSPAQNTQENQISLSAEPVYQDGGQSISP